LKAKEDGKEVHGENLNVERASSSPVEAEERENEKKPRKKKRLTLGSTKMCIRR
jgi:hypothetical protein